jgi:O-antigen/teichoic acid export membrane protein
VAIAGTVLISWLPLPVVRGLLQGVQRFWRLGASFAVEGLLKLGAGILLVSAGMGLSGAVAAISLGSLGAFAVTMIGLRRQIAPRSVDVHPRGAFSIRTLIPYAIAVSTFAVLTQSDVVLVKILFPPAAAGVYAAASTGGKIVLYLTAPLAMAMLPEVVRRHSRNNGQRSVLLRTAAFGALAGGLLVAAYLIAPRRIISLLFGAAYIEGAPLMWLVGLGMLANELALLGVYYLLATRRPAVLRWLSAHAVLFLVVLWAFATRLEMVALLVAATGVIACAGVWWSLRASDLALQPQRQAV